MDNTIPLHTLPPEIRELIWTASLPPPRLFHVQNVVTTYSPRESCFVFYKRHVLPVALGVCSESRAAALRAGFLLRSPGRDVWFNPDSDTLYIDRNHRRFIQGKAKAQPAGLDRIKHLGVEWRAWFLDVPTLSADQVMLPRWRAAFEALDVVCPMLETINFVLPQIRHCGGVTFGREPYGAGKHGCHLVPLPLDVGIPWGTRLDVPPTDMAATGLAQLGAVQLGRLLTARLSNWDAVRRQMARGLEHGDEEESQKKTPEVLGWWLLREDTNVLLEHRDVKRFL